MAGEEYFVAVVDRRSRRIVKEIPGSAAQHFLDDFHLGSETEPGELRLPPRLRVEVGGVPVDVCTSGEVRDQVATALADGASPALLVASINLDHLQHFGVRSPKQQRAIAEDSAWLMTADGAPIAWAVRRVIGRTQPRIAGSDLLPDLLRVARDQGVRVGFLGGLEEMKQRLAVVLDEEFPGLDVGGHWTPSRAELEGPGAADIADKIKAAGIDLLVVGLGKPRQEMWLAEYAARSGISVGLAFGASADFLAGLVTRAPGWARSNGMEWLYRLYQEPSRLYRRYLIQGPRVFIDLLTTRRGTVSLFTHPYRRARELNAVDRDLNQDVVIVMPDTALAAERRGESIVMAPAKRAL